MFVYLETSAVNYFMQHLSAADARATRALQRYERGRIWAVSPVTIWEILNTSCVAKRDRLVFFCRQIATDILLPSPEELVFSFMSKGCPAQEDVGWLESSSDLATTWKSVCHSDSDGLKVDHDELRARFKMLVPITRDLHRITRNRDLTLEPYALDAGMDATLESVVNGLSWVRGGEAVSAEQRKIYKIAVFFVLFMLCAEIGVDSTTTRRFWLRVGVHGIFDRFRYLLNHYETILHRGPVMDMAYMTYAQTRGKFTRGVFWDSLHASYLAYVNWLLSEDNDFQTFRSAISWHPNRVKIHRPSEMGWTYSDAFYQ